MSEHLSNGQFASKEVTATEDVGNRGRFKKGHARLGGRAPGTPNRTTRAVKEFLAALVDKPEVQDAVECRIIKGDAVAFFRALEHVVGKPAERVRVDLSVVNIETVLEQGRKRVARG